MECRGSVHRIKQCADDLLVSMEDVLVDEDDHKKNLTDLANNFFFCIDEAKLVLFQLASEFLPMINEILAAYLTRFKRHLDQDIISDSSHFSKGSLQHLRHLTDHTRKKTMKSHLSGFL
ncbi:hypothetical protein J5N97_013391 [Dioscorea zingiberensis]|uniref:Uncharacterized protein n=1 Tax=Dioscorea zingiberensis TaxID=325984 RepID=A0A9D5CS25_9LILI|nr:hypothetical protein J5N97_013391 [Dioscorea zingiberensis]